MLKALCAALLAFVLALAIAHDAGAKPRSFVIPCEEEIELELRGSSGSKVEVVSSRDEVDVTASRGLATSFAPYTVGSLKRGERGFEAKAATSASPSPGSGPPRLTGKRFEAQLCVRDRCAGDGPR